MNFKEKIRQLELEIENIISDYDPELYDTHQLEYMESRVRILRAKIKVYQKHNSKK